MDRRELEKLIQQYKEAYPQPGPLEVADVVARLELALTQVGYLKLFRTRAHFAQEPMVEAKAVFRPTMRPVELAREDVAKALEAGFASAPTFKFVQIDTASGADYRILARSRPEAPVDAVLHLEAA